MIGNATLKTSIGNISFYWANFQVFARGFPDKVAASYVLTVHSSQV